ncbi:MAG: glycosyltransferase family 4 protein [Anaerovoracaceae bacterium]|jgi:glycosyltransferase involved in cell wall biosynthesis
MNIVYICHYAGSPDMGMAFRPYYFAREWVRDGHNVTIIAASYSHLRIRNPEVTRSFQEEYIDGIRYIWIKTGTYDHNGIDRALTMFEFVGTLYRKAELIAAGLEPDVIITSSTYPADTYAGQRIRKVCERRPLLIHEVHDMWPLTPIVLGGMSPHHPFIMAMQAAENSAYKHSDYVVSLLPSAEGYMKEHGLEDGKFRYIPNGVVTEEWNEDLEMPAEHAAAFRKLRDEGKFIVGFFGSHHDSNALENIIDVVNELKDRGAALVMIGEGRDKPKFIEHARETGADNVVFLPQVEKKYIPPILKKMDAIYIGMLESPLPKYGICLNKMFDSMMSGKPIIMAITTPRSPVSDAGCGIMTDSGDNAGIKAALGKLMSMTPGERQELGERGRTAIMEKYTYRKLAGQFEELFRNRAGAAG